MYIKRPEFKNVCMVVYAYYPQDPRVRRAAEALGDKGYEVDVICVKDKREPLIDKYNKVRIYRIPMRMIRGGSGRYLYQYLMFFISSFVLLTILYSIKGYRVVHIHSLPDFEAFASAIPKFFGAKIILDLHELSPELYAARFKKDMTAIITKVFIFFERISCRFAHQVITVNQEIKDIYKRRNIPSGKITVIMNSPVQKLLKMKDLSEFSSSKSLNDKFVISYIGGINPERNLEVAIKAVSILKRYIPNIYFLLFGYGDMGYIESLRKKILQEGLNDYIYFGGRLAAEDVASYLRLGNLGIVSYEKNLLTDFSIPNKVFECSALEIPMVIARLLALESLFKDAAIFYEPANAEDLAKKIKYAYDNPQVCLGLAKNAKNIYEKHKWPIMKERLYALYDGILSR